MCCQAWGSYLVPRIAFIVPPPPPPPKPLPCGHFRAPKPLPGDHSPSAAAAVAPCVSYAYLTDFATKKAPQLYAALLLSGPS